MFQLVYYKFWISCTAANSFANNAILFYQKELALHIECHKVLSWVHYYPPWVQYWFSLPCRCHPAKVDPDPLYSVENCISDIDIWMTPPTPDRHTGVAAKAFESWDSHLPKCCIQQYLSVLWCHYVETVGQCYKQDYRLSDVTEPGHWYTWWADCADC